MGKKIKFKVYDSSHNEVTNDYEWYIDANGDLYYMTKDIDMPLQSVDDGFYYEIEQQ